MPWSSIKRLKALKLTCAVFAVALLAAFALHDLDSDDIWWHLKSGQIIYASARPPISDSFSHTIYGNAWGDEAWLAQLILYLIFAAFGPNGLTLLQFFLLLASLAAIYAICARKSLAIFLAALPFALIAASPRFIVRPFLFTFFFTALFLFILDRNVQRPGRLIFVLPLFQILWTNIHGGFPLGPAIIFIYLADQSLAARRNTWRFAASEEYPRGPLLPLFIVGFASLAATLVNPYGPKFALAPIRLMIDSSITGHIAEFQPTFSSETLSFSLKAYIGLVSIGAVSFLLNIKKFRPRAVLIYALFLYLSLAGVRFVALFSFVVLPIIVINLDEWGRRIFSKKVSLSSWRMERLAEKALYCLLIVGQGFLGFYLVTDAYYIRENRLRRTGMGISMMSFPVGALDFISDNSLAGNFFNTIEYGGYMIWRGYPAVKVFIDGRVPLYGAEFLEQFLRSFEDQAAWEQLASRYGVDYVLTGYAHGEANLIRGLYRSPQWELIYFDANSALFAKKKAAWVPTDEHPPKTIHAVPESKETKKPLPVPHRAKMGQKRSGFIGWLSSLRQEVPRENLNLGLFYYTIGRYDLAAAELSEAIKKSYRFTPAHHNLGLAFEHAGSLKKAMAEYKIALGFSGKDALTHYNLGNVLKKAGQPQRALTHYSKSAQLNRSFAAPSFEIGNIQYESGKVDESIASYRKTVRLDPSDFKAHNNLANAHAHKDHIDRAIFHYKTSVSLRPDYAEARSNLGIAFLKRNLHGKATESFLDAVRLNPTWSDGRRNLAAAFYLLGAKDRSLFELKLVMLLGGEVDLKLLKKLSGD